MYRKKTRSAVRFKEASRYHSPIIDAVTLLHDLSNEEHAQSEGVAIAALFESCVAAGRPVVDCLGRWRLLLLCRPFRKDTCSRPKAGNGECTLDSWSRAWRFCDIAEALSQCGAAALTFPWRCAAESEVGVCHHRPQIHVHFN